MRVDLAVFLMGFFCCKARGYDSWQSIIVVFTIFMEELPVDVGFAEEMLFFAAPSFLWRVPIWVFEVTLRTNLSI
jgi:hypothetical protein